MARALARNGASVVINYVSDTSAPRAANVVADIEASGGRAVAVQGTVESVEGARSIVTQSLELLGTDTIDILGEAFVPGDHTDHVKLIGHSIDYSVNNAGGVNAVVSLIDIKPSDIEKDFSINVFSNIYMIQAVVPYMPHGGRIVNVGSVVSRMQTGAAATYGASKAALDFLTGSWAVEVMAPLIHRLVNPRHLKLTWCFLQLGHTHGITVNTVGPGPTATDMGSGDNPVIRRLLSMVKADARQGTVNDVADAVLLLAQEKSRWITGQWIDVSGGIIT